MKTKFALLACAIASALALRAAPLSETAAVQTRPEANAPVLTYLKAGTEPASASDIPAPAPPGWLAVEVPGPVEGYVQQKDLTKGLEVKPGVSVLLAPKLDAGVLLVADKALKTTITGIHGRWTQLRIQSKVIGYVYLGASPAPAPLAQTAPEASVTASFPAPAPLTNAPGHAAAGDSASALPRFFQGTFVSTRRAFYPRRPFDWALNDASGTRFAYLDVSRLLLTEQIDTYVGHEVVVFGAAVPVEGTKEIVIQIESLQLR